jgi:hypothetical protein
MKPRSQDSASSTASTMKSRLWGRVPADVGEAGRHRRRHRGWVTSAEAKRIKELEQEVRELRPGQRDPQAGIGFFAASSTAH